MYVLINFYMMCFLSAWTVELLTYKRRKVVCTCATANVILSDPLTSFIVIRRILFVSNWNTKLNCAARL